MKKLILSLFLTACGVSPPVGSQSTPFSETYILEKGCRSGYELQLVVGKAPNVVYQWKDNEKIWLWLEGESDAKKYLKKEGAECKAMDLKDGEKLWFLSLFGTVAPRL